MTDQPIPDDTPPMQPADRDAAMGQSLLLALGLLGTLFVFITAHFCQARDQILLRHRLAFCRQINGQYIDCRFYASPEERLLHKVIPGDDYSKGGVYFVGGSQMERSLAVWDCTPAEQAVIHNYCLAASPHSREFQFVKYLVDRRKILEAGGDKNMVVFDLCFSSAAHFPTPSTIRMAGLWTNDFTEHGMYRCDDGGITTAGGIPLWRSACYEKIGTDAVCKTVVKTLQGVYPGYFLAPTTPSPAYIKYWADYLGPDWKAGIDIEVDALGRMIDYLRERHVAVEAVYLPLGSWFDDFEPAIVYRGRVLAMLATRGVHVTDLDHLVADDCLGDSVHPDYKGTRQISPILVEIARTFLRARRILPTG
jgi:hypothetical protein